MQSIPDTIALAEVVAAAWQLRVGRCRHLQHTVNDTYLADLDDRRAIVRVYGTERGTIDDVDFELQWLLQAQASGVAVAAPLPLPDGSLAIIASVEEGERVIALFELADGRSPTYEDAELIGVEAARLHNHGDTFDHHGGRRPLDLDYLIGNRIEPAADLLSDRPDRASWFRQFATEVHRRLELDTKAEDLDWGPCHGDLHAGNAAITDRACLFDFEFAGPGWRIYDLATFKWSADLRPAASTGAWTSFLRGYSTERQIGDTDPDLVDLFVAARCVWLLGHWARAEGDPGKRWFTPENLDFILDLATRLDTQLNLT